MTIAVIPDITFTVNPFPQPGTPVWDDDAFEWHMHDEDSQIYWGDTPIGMPRTVPGADAAPR